VEVTAPDVHCAHDEMVPIDKMRPNPKNPNTHPQKQIELLAKIIKWQGWRNPIVVSKRSGLMTKGHARLAAAIHLKLTEVPVDFQEYADENQEIEDMVADNRIAELAEIDKTITSDLLRTLQEAGRDLDLTGFGQDAVAKMMEDRKEEEKPEVQFTEELMESHNYIVLYCDNETDWLQLQTLYPLKTVKALDSRPGFEKQGVGRVVRWSDFINKILEKKS